MICLVLFCKFVFTVSNTKNIFHQEMQVFPLIWFIWCVGFEIEHYFDKLSKPKTRISEHINVAALRTMANLGNSGRNNSNGRAQHKNGGLKLWLHNKFDIVFSHSSMFNVLVLPSSEYTKWSWAGNDEPAIQRQR
jgi:hypothetical protein